MMRTSRAIPIVLCAAAGSACAPTRESAERDLRARAAYDLSCPVNKLVFTPMSDDKVVYDGRETDTPKTMGVTGCGHVSTYVWVKDKGYVMNNNTTTTITSSP
jgi:hypothetical protein